MHNRLNIRKYNISTGALYTSAIGMEVATSKKGGGPP